jgi:hypothetical protein
MKNKTGRIVVVGIVIAWIMAAIRISNENAYKRVLSQQEYDISSEQAIVGGYRESIKNYEKTPEHYEYQNAVKHLPDAEHNLEKHISIYEANVEYYNTHWFLLRRPTIYPILGIDY